ncbi:hypothetical protein ACAF76_006035 [Brevibacillus sp. TJ4]|uniref:hypothetical protein n=1 Tax=Brevibacillus sp. TJ4 TaxID=3234853 RepID=UPI0037D4D3A7
MSEEFVPKITPDPTLSSPSRDTLGEVLDRETFFDLYELADAQGLPYFARLNAAGEVELFLVFESVDAFSEQTRDAVSLEFKTYRQNLLAVIWTLSDPLQPLGFPLAFDIAKEEDRYMALTMLDQPHIRLHYMAYEQGSLTHIYTEPIYLSVGEVNAAREMVRALYEGKDTEAPGDEQVQEEEAKTIPAICLPVEVLQETGMAYVFDYATLLREHGEEAAHHQLMGTVQQAMLVMRRHSHSEVRDSSFTIWVGEQASSLYLVVTPALQYLFEELSQPEDEANPFSRFFAMLAAYREKAEASPLRLGAFPILRYEAGKLYHLEIDAHTQELLARLHQQVYPQAGNPYQEGS